MISRAAGTLSGLRVWGEIGRSALHTSADENVDPRLQQLVYDRQLALAQDISTLPFEATTNLEHIQRVTAHSDAPPHNSWRVPRRSGLEVHDVLRAIAQRDVLKSMCADLDFLRKVMVLSPHPTTTRELIMHACRSLASITVSEIHLAVEHDLTLAGMWRDEARYWRGSAMPLAATMEPVSEAIARAFSASASTPSGVQTFNIAGITVQILTCPQGAHHPIHERRR